MKTLVGFVQNWKYRAEISTGLNLLDPHEVKIMCIQNYHVHLQIMLVFSLIYIFRLFYYSFQFQCSLWYLLISPLSFKALSLSSWTLVTLEDILNTF